MSYMHYTYTRSGLAPTIVDERVPTERERLLALTVWVAPHTPATAYQGTRFLTFRNRYAFEAFKG